MLAEPEIPRGWRILELTPRSDYFAIWARIREQTPVRDGGDGVFFVSSWELVNKAMRHPDLRAGSGTSQGFGGAGSPVESVVQNWLMSQNGEQHRHARALVSRLFTPSAVARLETLIRERATALVAPFVAAASKAPADFVDAVAQRLPSEVVRHLFAIEREEWATHVEPLFVGDGLTHADGFAAVQGLADYFHHKIAGAADRQFHGVIDDLRAPDRQGNLLLEAEVIANSVLIVTAAIDTTAGMIANTLLRLMEHPDAQARVVADPSLIPATVDESLRHCPSAPSTTRHAPTGVTLGEFAIPAGSDLFLSLAAANRDPLQFELPDQFRIERDCASTLTTFGGGPHFCLGAALARLEARLLFEALFQAGERFELRDPVQWRVNNPNVRAPARLLVSCAVRGAA